VRLAKQHLDVGLFTNDLEPMLEFWQGAVGLPFEEVLPTGGGGHQHRHGLNGGVLKINHIRDPLPKVGPSGYSELVVAKADLSAPQSLVDPDGNRVRLVPVGFEGVASLAISIEANDVAVARKYYSEALGFSQEATGDLRCGETLVRVSSASVPRTAELTRAPGYRYLTVQVWDCDAEYARALANGASSGGAPRTMGSVARFGFVCDPDGNWLEISQRASLTGPLPPN